MDNKNGTAVFFATIGLLPYNLDEWQGRRVPDFRACILNTQEVALETS